VALNDYSRDVYFHITYATKFAFINGVADPLPGVSNMRQILAAALMGAITFGPIGTPEVANAANPAPNTRSGATATPVKHLVVIFQENVSFDHYFGSYPVAANPPGEPQFKAALGTPTVNGLSQGLLIANPNLNPANGPGAGNPFRLDRSQAATADQDHGYSDEQAAFDGGIMDLFPLKVGTAGSPPNPPPGIVLTKGLVLGSTTAIQ
jgi:phospholipase C